MALFGSLFGKKAKEEGHVSPNDNDRPTPGVAQGIVPPGSDLAGMNRAEDRAAVLSMVAQKTAATLLAMYEKRPGGFRKDEEEAAAIRSIGERLIPLGGTDLMLEVHRLFAKGCGSIGEGLAENLDMIWDGIGKD